MLRERLGRRGDRHERRRQLHRLGAPVLRLPLATATQLAPLSGAMGYGLPAAVAAKLVHPERDVVCLAGDGDFLMSAQRARDRRAVRRADRRPRGRQRDVRDDPDAPGAALPRPGQRDRAPESGLRGARPGVRRPRRADRADRGGAGRPRPRARSRRAGGAPPARRPRGADAARRRSTELRRERRNRHDVQAFCAELR